MGRSQGKDNTRDSLRFEVDAYLLLEIGERLVARRSVALAELIKNAYDADATDVTITFDRVTEPGGTIVVQDNGNGMTLDKLKTAWMRIATPDARDNPTSARYARPRTGAKGVGRFACRRLAQRLELSSVAERGDGRRERILISFDWDRFKSGHSIQEIRTSYTTEVVNNDVGTGVTLRLQDARDVWTENDFSDLHRDILGLISPLPDTQDDTDRKNIASDPGLNLKLIAPEFPRYEGLLRDVFLEASWGILSGSVDRDGQVQYRLKIRKDEQTLTFQPQQLFFKHLNDAKFKIHYFVYKAELLKSLDFNVAAARQLGRRKGGVRIYLDGFRVFPYGDPGDDWLDLDRDRAQRQSATPRELLGQAEGLYRPMLLLPGNMQLFGAVSISRIHNPDVDLNISRERLVENEAFEELRKFIRHGIDWATIQYARVKAEGAKPAETSTQVSESLTRVRQLVSEAAEAEEPQEKNELLHRAQHAVNRVEKIARRQEEERISELSMMRVLASAGVSVMIFQHSLQSLISGLNRIQAELLALQSSVSGPKQERYTDAVSRLGNWANSAEQQARLVGLLVRGEARDRRRRLVLKPIIDELGKAFEQYMSEYGVEFANVVPAHVRLPAMFEAEIHAILLNLLTNALKAVRAQPVRRIEIAAAHEDDGTHILMRDSGIGIDHAVAGKAFEPFVTTSTPDPLLGQGTGLGLKIVRDLVQAYGGRAAFIEPTVPWKTCIEIMLPGE